MTATLEQIGAVLAGSGGRAAFAARRTSGVEDLHLEVRGEGRVRLPVSRAQGQRLCRLARPARYGKRAVTLLDDRVRSTWQIAKTRVKIDARRWNTTLVPMLDRLRRDLGLPDGRTLKAELHSMLVYAPGQFFLPHQDSEKSDDMIGTLVVTLPSQHKGGAFVVEHGGESVTYRGSKDRLTFVAFYADCQHEVRPVTDGYRVVLTYNLLLARDRSAGTGTAARHTADATTMDSLAKLLREHFTAPERSRRHRRDELPAPPSRFFYLLDHQYTERGLAWDRLKGEDAARAGVLRAAAERADCELALALANVHELYECDNEWDMPRYRPRQWWDDDDDDDDDHFELPSDGDRYTLGALQDWTTTLNRWIPPGSSRSRAVDTIVYDGEICSTRPTSELEPYASEYEGYMGNYGNTMDRWYRRAAIMVWPRTRDFVVRAELEPGWALDALAKRIRAGPAGEARTLAAELAPFWNGAATSVTARGFFGKALSVATGLASPQLAMLLLRPFRIEALEPMHAAVFARLVGRYGEAWTAALLEHWSAGPALKFDEANGIDWTRTLPALCRALSDVAEPSASLAARLLIEDRWDRLQQRIGQASSYASPGERDAALRELAHSVVAVLESAWVSRAQETCDVIVSHLRADEHESLLPCSIAVLRMAADAFDRNAQRTFGLESVRHRCVDLLATQLAAPVRAAGDWSISPPDSCRRGCELCATLASFLRARDRTQFEWKLAKERRRHIHTMLDAFELPVRHETRRKGSPFTLVLTKTKALFEREHAARGHWQADLDWLTNRSF